MMYEDSESKKGREEYLNETPSEQLELAKCLLESAYILDTLKEHIRCMGVAGEQELAVTLYLVGTSRLLAQPLAAIVQGPSSSGKSYVIEKVASLFPPEMVLFATDMTANALYYMPHGSLRHRFVVAGERGRKQDDDTAVSTKALREMVSAGRISKSVALPNHVAGTMETRLIEQEGPIAYVESTTAAKVYEEDGNRCILLQTDERPEQTRRIINARARNAAGREELQRLQTIIEIHHTLQRLLEPRSVIVPYAERLGELFDCRRVEARRAFPQLLQVVRSSALLHQMQRDESPNGEIIASAADYEIARGVLAQPLARSLGGALSDSACRFYDQVRQLEDRDWTAPQLSRILRSSPRTIRDHLQVLQDVEAAECVETKRGRQAAKWRICRDVDLTRLAENTLPTISDTCELSTLTAKLEVADESGVPF